MTQIIRDESSESSGTNTILLVLLIAGVVAFGVWFFTQRQAAPAPQQTEDSGINLEVNLPPAPQGGTSSEGGTQNPGQ